ncbi:MAG: RusA family crossover junction endodeoxyribonuclease [Syntrophobacteraceae bacterium]
MTEHVSFAVEGEPRAKQSFRFSRRGHFTDPRIKEWQNAVAWQARIAMQGMDPICGKVAMRVTFYLRTHHRVDLDNLQKAVGDALAGIVYKDDSQIVNLQLEKRINKIPGVLVEVCKGSKLPGNMEGK